MYREAIDLLKDFWHDAGGVMVILLGAFLLIFALVVALVYPLGKAACTAKTTSFESRHGILTGCQIKIDGKWYDWDSNIIAHIASKET